MNRRKLLQVVVLLLLAAAVVGLWFSPVREQLTRDNVRAFVEHLRGLWYGPAIFIGAFMLACVFALPASVFVIAAGFIWGWLLGSTYAVIGGMLGALTSFYLGRFVGEGMLEKFGRLGRVVARQVDHAGFRSLLVLRFIPGIPFAVLNYGAGVAGVRLRDFLGSTLVGVIPSMFVFAYCADALFNGSMSEGDAFKRLAVVCALMLAIILLPVAVKRFARRPAIEAE
ncbi:MAG TPA: VTT domain-containing protein [Thermoanaerobaculia bacterium]|nr:VTT domain-containing protein [Thermoanaerobaculia bacterium]